MPTAATDGKRFYWNPKFVLKQSRIGLRIICGHEAWHALYMHPQRRGSRLPKLWNIAVDYIVNGTVMEDLKTRKQNPAECFKKHLGNYMTLPQYCELLKDPFSKIKGFEDLDPIADNAASDVVLPNPNEDRELTAKEIKELEKREKAPKFYFADPDLEEDMKRPEKIYDILYKLLPKCSKCGRIGIYQPPKPKPQKGKGKGKKKEKGDQQAGDQQQGDQQGQDQGDQQGQDQGDQPGDQGQGQHDHGDGQGCGCGDPNGQNPGQGSGQGQSCNGDEPCDECGGGVDVFGLGNTLDDHMDTEESQEKLAKRISEAMESAKRMAGHIPAALEDELGKLTAPKISWRDIIRARLLKARAGNGRNDWTKFRTRPQHLRDNSYRGEKLCSFLMLIGLQRVNGQR